MRNDKLNGILYYEIRYTSGSPKVKKKKNRETPAWISKQLNCKVNLLLKNFTNIWTRKCIVGHIP